jgi:glycosyltransferase involved in cell wall biosynthesis
MSAAPRVSVVMPMFNTERYVAAAIRSALDEGFADVEVLVIDDGSTDGSVAAARSVADPRVTVITLEASGGPSRPRNVGLARARAPYVSLLDSDDLLKPGKLVASVAALDRCPSAGLAFGDFEKIDSDGKVLERSVRDTYPRLQSAATEHAARDWYLIRQPDFARTLLYENFIGTSGVVARRDLVVQVGGFDESLPNSNDRDLWFRLAHRCDALYSPRLGHSYRVHAASVVHGPVVRNTLTRITVLRRERDRWRDPAALRQLNRLIAENYAVLGYHQRRRRQRWSAVGSFVRAFAISPDWRWLKSIAGAALLSPEEDA